MKGNELIKKYGACYEALSRENSKKWKELKSDRSNPWQKAKEAYKIASLKKGMGFVKEDNKREKKFSSKKADLTDKLPSSDFFGAFNGIGLNLNLGYLGIGAQRIFHRGRDVDYIYFQYNHKPGVNISGTLFKVLDFDEESYKGWFVDGEAFFRGLGIDFFTSPNAETPVCRGWGINLAYPPESGISIVPQYYDTPSGWMRKVFGVHQK